MSNEHPNSTANPAPIMRPPAPATGRLNTKAQAKQARQGGQPQFQAQAKQAPAQQQGAPQTGSQK